LEWSIIVTWSWSKKGNISLNSQKNFTFR
jgi:hypothetical protein